MRLAVSAGCFNATSDVGPTPWMKSLAERAIHPNLSRTIASAKPARSRSSPSGASGLGPRSSPCSEKSKTFAAIIMAPCPSAMAWCNFKITAALPPGSPSSSVSRHSGRSRSKSVMLWRRASSRTSRHVEPAGILKRRMWNVRSKFESNIRRGVVSPPWSMTFCRKTVLMREARSNRSSNFSQSGVDSVIKSPMIADRKTGSSDPLRHVAKSKPFIRSACFAAS